MVAAEGQFQSCYRSRLSRCAGFGNKFCGRTANDKPIHYRVKIAVLLSDNAFIHNPKGMNPYDDAENMVRKQALPDQGYR